MKSNSHTKSLGAELRLILKRARQVWRLVPRRHKLAFGGAILVMALTSACNTAMPLLLGGLVAGVVLGALVFYGAYGSGKLLSLAGICVGIPAIAFCVVTSHTVPVGAAPNTA